MYGWINASLESLVISKFGVDTWKEIREKSGLQISEIWNRYENYPDSYTYDLVGAATAVLGLEASEILEVFGQYFLRYVKDEGYDNLLRCLGSDLQTWLSNVNMLHVHLGRALPKMIAPQFWCEIDVQNTAIILHYKSARGSGLAPIVVGVVREAALEYFGIVVDFERLSTQDENGSAFTSWRIRETDVIDPDRVKGQTTSDFHNLGEDEVSGMHGVCPFDHSRLSDTEREVDRGLSGNVDVVREAKISPTTTRGLSRKLRHGTKIPLKASQVSPPSSPRSSARSTSLQFPVGGLEASPLSASVERPPGITRTPSFMKKLMGGGHREEAPSARKWSVGAFFNGRKATQVSPGHMDSPKVAPAAPSHGRSPSPLSRQSASSDEKTSHRLSKQLKAISEKLEKSSKKHGLSGSQLQKVFPFHVVFDRNLTILQHGDSLDEFLGEVNVVGENIQAVFSIASPSGLSWSDWETIVGSQDAPVEFVLNTVPVTGATSRLRLIGQMLLSDDNSVATFLGTPNVSKLDDMTSQCITFSHMSLYDCRSQVVLVTEHLHSETEAGHRVVTMSKQLAEEKNKRMELMRAAAEEAEDSLATKRAFVRYVSHEIRTPLSVCKLGLDLIQSDIDSRCGQDCVDNLKDCQDSIDIAVTILNDLLSYEKLESGIMEVYQDVTKALPFVSKTLSPFSLQARQKNVNFETNVVAKDFDEAYMYIDSSKMSQVIRNLASNALKFTPTEGLVTVDMKVVPRASSRASSPRVVDDESKENGALGSAPVISSNGETFHHHGEFVRVEFVDTGVGISEANQDKVFKEIVQFSPNELQAGGGSGLGLWISHGIVNLHGGCVGMHSDGEGKGSTFFFEVPLYRPFVCGGDGEGAAPMTLAVSEQCSGRISVRLNKSQCELSDTDDYSSFDQEIAKPEVEIVPEDKKATRKSDFVDDASDENKQSSVVLDVNCLSKSSTSKSVENILRGKTVLIVDDAAMIRRLLHRTLTAKGAVCSDAEDGIWALRKLFLSKDGHASLCVNDGATEAEIESMIEVTKPNLQAYDIILMDYVMPNLDGLATVRILRRCGYRGFIAGATGNMMPSDVAEFLKAGADVILAKPLVVSDLENHVYSLSVD